jgi:hypothetical protein
MSAPVDAIQPVPVGEKNVSSTRPDDASEHSGSEDAEKQVLEHAPELKRKLKSRHLQMIAIGMRSRVLPKIHLADINQVEPLEQVSLSDLEGQSLNLGQQVP